MNATRPLFRPAVARRVGAVLAALATSCAATPEHRGWYVGGSLGTAVLELERGDGETTAFAFDEQDTAWKVFGGYRWEFPYTHLGLEGGYVDLGDPPAFFPGLRVDLDAAGINLWTVGGFDLGPFSVFGKLGGILWNIDGEATGTAVESFDESGFDLGTGFGAKVRLGSAELRGEVEQYDIRDTNLVQMYSVGVAWSF